MKKIKSRAKRRARSEERKRKGDGSTKTDSKKTRPKKCEAQGPLPRDFIEVREKIAALVKDSASEIAFRLIEVAKTGQLAPARYLFEAVGLYPPGADTSSRRKDSLAYRLLKSLGIPTEPLDTAEDAEQGGTAGGAELGGEQRSEGTTANEEAWREVAARMP